MDFKQIEAFISVAKLKSFSKAANTIYLSQPTISSHIASLEKDLNIQLFDRTSKEVNLTPAGRCFLEYALDIINIRNNAINSICDFNNHVSGSLNLSASTTPCNTIVPHLIDKFGTQYPNIKFNIKEEGSGEIVQAIEDLDCEIGIIGNRIQSDKIHCFKLMDDELIIISSPQLGLPSEISVEDLLKYKFIMRDRDSATRKTFEDKLIEVGVNLDKVNIFCEVNSLDTIVQFVKTAVGISILSKNVCKDYVENGKINISTIKGLSMTRGIYIVYNSKRTLSPTAKAFLNLCKEEFGIE